MLFISRHMNIVYTVVPSFVEIRGGRPHRSAPLRAYFASGRFDSDRAAAKSRWTEDEKKMVEDYLQDHEDVVRGTLKVVLDPEREPEAGFHAKRTGENPTCPAVVKVGSRAAPCGRSLVEGTPYCFEHQEPAAPEPKPKKETQKAGV